jgi:TonB family protein
VGGVLYYAMLVLSPTSLIGLVIGDVSLARNYNTHNGITIYCKKYFYRLHTNVILNCRKLPMKYFITLGFVLLLLPIVSAQSDTIYYLAADGSQCQKQDAVLYKKVKPVDPTGQKHSFEDYTMDGIILARGFYLDNTFSDKIGMYTEYYKNGNRKMKGTCLTDAKRNLKGVKINQWYYWYENGSIKLEELYGLDTTTNSVNSFIVNYWDTVGVKKVVEGNGDYTFNENWRPGSDTADEITFVGSVKDGRLDGIWKGYYTDGTLFCEETYNNAGLITGTSYSRDGKKYTYNTLLAAPEFPGGDSELIRFLQKNIRYPQAERDDDIQGKVLVRFFIDETGKVKNAIVIKSVSPGLDREALRVINLLPDFKPAAARGQGVKVSFRLPVGFRLQ